MTELDYETVSVGDVLPELKLTITPTAVVSGALASRDYSPLHHDKDYAINEAGQRNIFLNTPHQAALFERYLSDWAGPESRLGRMKFTMQASVYAGDKITIAGEVTAKEQDATGCCWLTLQLGISVADKRATGCTARLALPGSPTDNPWDRRGGEWQP